MTTDVNSHVKMVYQFTYKDLIEGVEKRANEYSVSIHNCVLDDLSALKKYEVHKLVAKEVLADFISGEEDGQLDTILDIVEEEIHRDIFGDDEIGDDEMGVPQEITVWSEYCGPGREDLLEREMLPNPSYPHANKRVVKAFDVHGAAQTEFNRIEEEIVINFDEKSIDLIHEDVADVYARYECCYKIHGKNYYWHVVAWSGNYMKAKFRGYEI